MAVAFRSVTSGTDLAPAEPAGCQAWDVLLAVVNCEDNSTAVVTPADGWAQVDNLFDESTGTGQQLMSGVYWTRRTNNHVANNWAVSAGGAARIASVAAYSGCVRTGDPWSGTPVLALGSDDSAEYGSLTTDVDDCMVVGLQTVHSWATTTATGGWAERLDQGAGGPAHIYDQAQASAGTSPALTVTGASNWVAHLLALAPDDGSPLPDLPPGVHAVSAVAEGTGAVVRTFPTHQADDILLIYCETGNEAITTPSGGWALVPDTPVTQANTNATRLTVFWLRATGAGTASPTIADPGNHLITVSLVIRGCITTGDPWDVTSQSVENTSDTSGSITGDTTTVAECLVLASITTGVDVGSNGTAQFSAWANSDLASVTERVDLQRAVGNGGNIGIASGEKATAGAYGATTVTLANADVKAMHTVAFKPPAGGAAEVEGSGTGTLTITGTATGVRTIAGSATGTISLAGSATGTRHVTGTASGALSISGAATGTRVVGGVATGALVIVGTATGIGEAEGVKLGSGTGTISLTGTATGTRVVGGAAVGSLAVSGTASGVRTVHGVASGAVAITGTAVGTRVVLAAAAGALVLAGTAAGVRTVVGTGSGSLTIVGTASGGVPAAFIVGHATSAVTAAGATSVVSLAGATSTVALAGATSTVALAAATSVITAAGATSTVFPEE